ncbi:MAG TPA: carboxypeptidase-like regulatory domain-containing protein [Terriglobia bacterium]|nr:carboxypeptidase-like regulatory domain-containing protein [Terriglobia bacterium]
MQKKNDHPAAVRFISLVLVLLLAGHTFGLALRAQEVAGPKLKIIVLEGEGAINNIQQRTAREPIIQVQDENNRPVAGALVLFALPENGAGGSFANDTRTYMTTTDAQGNAVAHGLKPNKTEGAYQIAVTVTLQSLKATAMINQSNVAGGATAAAGGVTRKLIVILAIAGGAAAGGIVAATHGGGSSTSTSTATTPPTSVSLGPPTVGAPK